MSDSLSECRGWVKYKIEHKKKNFIYSLSSLAWKELVVPKKEPNHQQGTVPYHAMYWLMPYE